MILTPKEFLIQIMKEKKKILGARYFIQEDEKDMRGWREDKCREIVKYLSLDESGDLFCPFCIYYHNDCDKCIYGFNHGICNPDNDNNDYSLISEENHYLAIISIKKIRNHFYNFEKRKKEVLGEL